MAKARTKIIGTKPAPCTGMHHRWIKIHEEVHAEGEALYIQQHCSVCGQSRELLKPLVKDEEEEAEEA